MKNILKTALAALIAATAAILPLSSCSRQQEIVIYSNADEEAKLAMQEALDRAGYAGQYILSSFSTSELGGKIMAEGKNTEADIITASTYYLESAQKEHGMYRTLEFPVETLTPANPAFAPVTGQEGAIFINTRTLTANNLPRPQSLKDLARPEYKGHISIPNLRSSSTAWLMVQALVHAYGEQEATRILKEIVGNAGPHLENSGSAPLKKARAGEVSIAFGLRHQAVADKKSGLPIDYIDPTEGNYILTESIAVIDKGDKTNPLAMKMAEIIVKEGRQGIRKTYPAPLYKGETSTADAQSDNIRTYPEPLTVDLLRKHQNLMPH